MSNMYLVLNPSTYLNGGVGYYDSLFCDDIELVSKAARDGATVYKLNSLKKIEELKIFYEEVIEEASDE